MQAELSEIIRFLAQHPPFDALADSALAALANQVEVAYYRADEQVLAHGAALDALYVVRTGAIELHRKNGDLYHRLAAGGIFGHAGLMLNRRVRFAAYALEDTLLYCIPVAVFETACEADELFAEYFEAEQAGLLHHAVQQEKDSNDLTSVKVAQCVHRAPMVVPPSTSVQAVAQLMTSEQISALLIAHLPSHTEPHSAPLASLPIKDCLGIITDADLRARVLAEGLPADTAIREVMTPQPLAVNADAYLYEAMLRMLHHNVQHLPVHAHGEVKGLLAIADILQHESQNSLLLLNDIQSASDAETLQRHSARLPAVFARLVLEDANSHMIGSAMSAIASAFIQQWLTLAEARFGAPPVPYCFIALGSLARKEQMLVTDQDNALILHDDYDAALHADYFAQLSEYVCDGLARCGYPLCSGDIMARNPRWRLTLQQWQEQFTEWMREPKPEALLHSNIFFDLDGIAGNQSLAAQLQTLIAEQAPIHPRFLACMAGNALNRTPPIGFFKEFVLERDGAHRDTINLKRRGTAPLSDLIRVHALAVGTTARNSFRRLDAIAESGLLPDGKAQDLSDALEYLSIIRARYQARALQSGSDANNQLNPAHLSAFERRSLKAAFVVIDSAQKFLKYRYTNLPAIK